MYYIYYKLIYSKWLLKQSRNIPKALHNGNQIVVMTKPWVSRCSYDKITWKIDYIDMNHLSEK